MVLSVHLGRSHADLVSDPVSSVAISFQFIHDEAFDDFGVLVGIKHVNVGASIECKADGDFGLHAEFTDILYDSQGIRLDEGERWFGAHHQCILTR